MELIHIHETKPKSRSCCSAATPLPASPPCETPPPSASLATRRVTTARGAGTVTLHNAIQQDSDQRHEIIQTIKANFLNQLTLKINAFIYLLLVFCGIFIFMCGCLFCDCGEIKTVTKNVFCLSRSQCHTIMKSLKADFLKKKKKKLSRIEINGSSFFVFCFLSLQWCFLIPYSFKLYL